MPKKCALCHRLIDVSAGQYANVYDEAWKMMSYHKECYETDIINEFLKVLGVCRTEN